MHSILKPLLQSSNEYPIIRIINLKKRYDRLWNIYEQATYSNILLVKGLIPINNLNHNDDDDDDNNEKEMMIWGDYAIDGTSTSTSTNDNIINKKYVSTHWNPNILKLFDNKVNNNTTNATNRNILLTSSEIACAMSHISCWKAILNTLTYCENYDYNIFINDDNEKLSIPATIGKLLLFKHVLVHSIKMSYL